MRTLTRHRRTSKCFLQLGGSVGLLGFVRFFAMGSSVFPFKRSALLNCHHSWLHSIGRRLRSTCVWRSVWLILWFYVSAALVPQIWPQRRGVNTGMPILNNLGNNFHFLEVLLGILGGWLPLGRLWRVGQPKKFTIVCLTRGLVKQEFGWLAALVNQECASRTSLVASWLHLGTIWGSFWGLFDDFEG